MSNVLIRPSLKIPISRILWPWSFGVVARKISFLLLNTMPDLDGKCQGMNLEGVYWVFISSLRSIASFFG